MVKVAQTTQVGDLSRMSFAIGPQLWPAVLDAEQILLDDAAEQGATVLVPAHEVTRSDELRELLATGARVVLVEDYSWEQLHAQACLVPALLEWAHLPMAAVSAITARIYRQWFDTAVFVGLPVWWRELLLKMGHNVALVQVGAGYELTAKPIIVALCKKMLVRIHTETALGQELLPSKDAPLIRGGVLSWVRKASVQVNLSSNFADYPPVAGAACGTPTVSLYHNNFQRQLWPDLTIPAAEPVLVMEALRKLEDAAVRSATIAHAQQQLEDFSFAACRGRMHALIKRIGGL